MISNARTLFYPLRRTISSQRRHVIPFNMGSSTSLSARPTASFYACQSRTFLSTPTLQEKHTINVPTMGDSITEGTIVEWVAPVGGAVSEGDVICLIETDKVTVDIKAEKDGVVVQHLGEVEGVVEVGEGLYILDTDLSVASASREVESKEAPAVETPKVDEAPAPAAPKQTTRVPSIHFLGKEGWEALRKGHSSSVSHSAASGTTIVSDAKPQSPTSITYQPYVHMYGRPSISDEEMEALMLGGADEAPEMKKDKNGVVSFHCGKVVTAGPRGVWLAEEKL